jgi:hypothetical protein
MPWLVLLLESPVADEMLVPDDELWLELADVLELELGELLDDVDDDDEGVDEPDEILELLLTLLALLLLLLSAEEEAVVDELEALALDELLPGATLPLYPTE